MMKKFIILLALLSANIAFAGVDPFADFESAITHSSSKNKGAGNTKNKNNYNLFQYLFELSFKQSVVAKNKNSAINPDNIYAFMTLPFQLEFDLTTNYSYKNIFDFKALMLFKVENSRNKLLNDNLPDTIIQNFDTSRYADLFINTGRFEFRYSPFEFLKFTIGYSSISNGFGSIFSPANYLEQGIKTLDTYSPGYLNATISGQFDFFNYSVSYLPAVDLKVSEGDNREWKRYFRFIETPNKEQFINLNFGFFFNGVNLQFYYFTREKEAYKFPDGVHRAAGTNISYSIFPAWEMHIEYLLGDGFDKLKNLKYDILRVPSSEPPDNVINYKEYSYENTRGNKLYHQLLFGTKFQLGGVDFILEYIYNGAAYDKDEAADLIYSFKYANKFKDNKEVGGLYKKHLMSSSFTLNPLYMANHFIFLDIQKRDIGDIFSIQNSLIFSPEDLSFLEKLTLKFEIIDNLILRFDGILNAGKKDGAFTSMPTQFQFDAGISYSF